MPVCSEILPKAEPAIPLFFAEPNTTRKYVSRCPFRVVKIRNIKPSIRKSLVDCSTIYKPLLAKNGKRAESARKLGAKPKDKNQDQNGSKRKSENTHNYSFQGATRLRIRVQKKTATSARPRKRNQLRALPSSRNGCFSHLLTASHKPQFITITPVTIRAVRQIIPENRPNVCA